MLGVVIPVPLHTLIIIRGTPRFCANHYQDLPLKLQSEGVDPGIPWLYSFKLDFL
jgi:hypothetical protein